MKGLVKLSDGTDYVEVVEEKLGVAETNGETPVRLDADKAQEYKQQAIEELTAEGVTFPVEADFYVASGNQTQLDNATVLKQAISDSLGDDFVVLNIKTYVSNQRTEVAQPRLHSFTFGGWGADYGDPQNYLWQETYGTDGAYYSNTYSNINDATDEELIRTYQEFTELVEAANAIVDDSDARYNAYAEAEAYFLENALTIPAYYDVQWQLTHINDYTKMYAMFGCQNFKYKNWETSVDAYTTEQYEAFASESAQ
jgi:oligopeptide transport system substrate-binding protein